MPTRTLPYSETLYFSTLICDYLSEAKALRAFYGHFPKIEHFKKQLEAKRSSFPLSNRERLVTQLMAQYGDVAPSRATLGNIDLLKHENTFTITTGHQLNLFTGPLYFLYKIITVLNLTEQLNKTYPDQHFVPVYWMASEDHDFEEINHFSIEGKTFAWKRKADGAVGELSTKGLEKILIEFEAQLGNRPNAKKLIDLFKASYLKHSTLAQATRSLVNELFGNYGLVILDGNDRELKKIFAPIVERELIESRSHGAITETTGRLIANGYPEQVHPREINLFYLKENLRERIIERDGTYYVDNTKISFSKNEMLDELRRYPERFSPNALLRPVYQEFILPNICYVGGGGELAYWFQLKGFFDEISLPFPILLLRNSALLVPSTISEKLKKLEVSVEDIFLKKHELKTRFTKRLSEIDIDFSRQKAHLRKQFEELYSLAQKTDASFVGAVAAQEKKQLNGLDHLEKRLLKAQKRNHSQQLERLVALQDALFPKQGLQERQNNFAEFYLQLGPELIPFLKERLAPLEHRFTIIDLDN
jgi:bacillithiol biosynthesis cysteine-adding enzyme BshC